MGFKRLRRPRKLGTASIQLWPSDSTIWWQKIAGQPMWYNVAGRDSPVRSRLKQKLKSLVAAMAGIAIGTFIVALLGADTMTGGGPANAIGAADQVCLAEPLQYGQPYGNIADIGDAFAHAYPGAA